MLYIHAADIVNSNLRFHCSVCHNDNCSLDEVCSAKNSITIDSNEKILENESK